MKCGSTISSGDITTIWRAFDSISWATIYEHWPETQHEDHTLISLGFLPSNSTVIDTDGNPFWMDSSDSWLPRLFRGVTMKVIPFLCNIGSQNVIVFPEPVAEIDTMLFLASNLNATLHCQMQAWTWNRASLSSCSSLIPDSMEGGAEWAIGTRHQGWLARGRQLNA